MRHYVRILIAGMLTILLFGACSLPPLTPVTRLDLMQTRVYSAYIIEESPEELLYALNTRGEVVVAAKRKVREKELPVHVKLLATADGIKVLAYER